MTGHTQTQTRIGSNLRVFLTENKIIIETTDPEIYDRLNEILMEFENYTIGVLDSSDIAQGIIALAYIHTDNFKKMIEIRLMEP